MGTYYRYVNHTKKEFVDLTDLKPGGGDKMNAALHCGPALVYLMFPYGGEPEGFVGRWCGDLVEIMGDQQNKSAFVEKRHIDPTTREQLGDSWHSDNFLGFYKPGEAFGTDPYTNISKDLREEMLREEPWLPMFNRDKLL